MLNVLGRDPRLAQVLVVGVRMMAGVRGFRGRRRRRKLGSLLRVLISEGEGNRVGDVIRVDGRGPGFNASAWIRVMAGAPVSWEEPSDAPNENTFYAPRRFQNFFL